jgi:hypothetical protein
VSMALFAHHASMALPDHRHRAAAIEAGPFRLKHGEPRSPITNEIVA